MEKINKIIKRMLKEKVGKEKFNAINVIKNQNIPNNDINDNNDAKKKFALDKTKFIPYTEESQLAEEIAEFFDDLNNYAFYFSVVNKLGTSRTRFFFDAVKADIREKEGKYAVRSPKRWFAWRYKMRLY